MKKTVLSIVSLLAAANAFSVPYLEINEFENKKFQPWPTVIDLNADKEKAFQDLTVKISAATVGKLTEYSVTLVNSRRKPALIRLTLKETFDHDGGGFWDGFEYHPDIRKAFIPKMNRYNFPVISYLYEHNLTFFGFAPETVSSRFERKCEVKDGKATLYFDAYLALNQGESDTVKFITGTVSDADSYTEAAETVYNAYPKWFRPVEGGDQRLYGVGGYMRASDDKDNRQYYQQEDNRRLSFDWEWYYNSYQKAGDFFPSPEYWNSKQGYKSEKNHATCDTPGTVEDWKKNHQRRTSAGDKTTALFYYYMQQYLNCDLLKNVYKDSAWVDEAGKPGYKAFGWGEEGWSEYAWPGASSSYGAEVRKDLALLWKTFDIAGFALDCVSGDVKYYGPLVTKEAKRAFDDNGKLFVAEGVAVAYNLDYTHNLPPKPDGRRAASVVNEPYTYLPIFHSDAVIHEMAPFEREDKIAPRRLQLGQKPYYWWGGFKVDNILDWDRLTPNQVNEALTGVLDHTILMSLRYGAVPPTFMSRGFPDMLKLRDLFVKLQLTGWRAAPYAWVDGVPGIEQPWAQDAKVWVSRFGDGDNSFIVLSIPDPAGMRGKLRIKTGKFNANNAVYADINGQPTTNYVTPEETVIDFDLKNHVPLILRKVGTSKDGQVTAKITKAENGDSVISITEDNSKQATKLEPAPVHFMPVNLKWIQQLQLSDGQKAFAAIAGSRDAVEQAGTPARCLEIYMEYFYGRKKLPIPYMYLMAGKFDKNLRFPIVSPGTPEAGQAKTLFAVGSEARKHYFPEVNATDTIIYRKVNGQKVVGFFPGKLNEGQLISAFLKELDKLYPYYGGNNLVRWTRRLNFYGKTFIKGQSDLDSAVGSPTSANTGGKAISQKKISVLQNDGKTFIRSNFSKDKDIIIITMTGKNKQMDFFVTRLVPAKLPATDKTFNSGTSIHYCNDDVAPVFVNGTYIGANHGAMAVIEVTSAGHGFSTKDLGCRLTAENRNFYLAKIPDANRLWLIPENSGKDGIWKFKVFSVIKDSLTDPRSGRTIKLTKVTPTQLLPSCRITRQEYLIDGEKMTFGTVATGDTFEVTEAYDIIAPDTVLEAVKRNPGKQVDFIDKSFPAMISVENIYQFQAGGTCLVKQRYKINRAVEPARVGIGLVQTQPLYPGKTFYHEYYIPKTREFEKSGRKFNFAGIEYFGDKMPCPIYFTASENNIADTNNLPDRFIQFLGEKNSKGISRSIGYALGYSPTYGITVPEKRVKLTNLAAFIYTTKKTYPMAVNIHAGKQLPAGTEFEAEAYRQYFVPEAASDNATDVYRHRSSDADMLYADYHKPTENDAIRIPSEWNGRKITVIEKSDGMTLNSPETIKDGVIKVSTGKGNNYLILRID